MNRWTCRLGSSNWILEENIPWFLGTQTWERDWCSLPPSHPSTHWKKQEKLVKVTEKEQRGGKTGKWVSWNLTESLEKFGGIIRCHRNYLVVTGGILNKDTEPDDIYYQGRVWGHRPYPGVHGCYRPGLPALVFVALKGIRRCLPRAKGRHTHGHRGGRIYPWPGPNLYK